LHEILRHVGTTGRVLDLGSSTGSYRHQDFPFATVRVDLDAVRTAPGVVFVQADASQLPFRAGVFDAVVCNHSLEHFVGLGAALDEIGRVLKPGGCLFVSVPDASAFSDRLFRWLSGGGIHVNAFVDVAQLIAAIEQHVGARHAATRPLYASCCFANPHNRTARAPRRFWILAGGREGFLRVGTWMLRWLDRAFGTRLSFYGWALFFGPVAETVREDGWSNVCVRCGAGHPAEELRLTRTLFWRMYRCPACGAENIFTPDTGVGL
jgi:SAM-dependent methyltransferase